MWGSLAFLTPSLRSCMFYNVFNYKARASPKTMASFPVSSISLLHQPTYLTWKNSKGYDFFMFYFMCIRVLTECMNIHRVHRKCLWESDPLSLELSDTMWALGNKARSSGRADGVLNLSDISPAQDFIIIKLETTRLIHGFFFFLLPLCF